MLVANLKEIDANAVIVAFNFKKKFKGKIGLGEENEISHNIALLSVCSLTIRKRLNNFVLKMWKKGVASQGCSTEIKPRNP